LESLIINDNLMMSETSMNKAALLGIALVGLMLRDARAASAVAMGHGTKLYPVAAYGDRTKETAKERALRDCFAHGGLNPRIVVATDKAGYGALVAAKKGEGKGVVIGIALGKNSQTEATNLAIQQCLKDGGVAPRILRQFWG
jgi:Domain of unknown function (DUF4189)